jgi:hypothetical protein
MVAIGLACDGQPVNKNGIEASGGFWGGNCAGSIPHEIRRGLAGGLRLEYGDRR